MAGRLTAGEERYGLLFERSTDGIWLADREGRFVDANPAACAMLGYSRGEHLRLSVGDVVRAGEEAPRLHELMRELASGHQVTDIWEIRRADGTYIPLELSHAFTPDGIWQAIGRDITERERREGQQEFLLTLSDALRPLTDAVEIQGEAARILGGRLGVERVAYAGFDGPDYVIERDWTDGVASLVGRQPIASYSKAVMPALRTGRNAISADVGRDLRIAPHERAAYAAIQTGSFVCVPLVKRGELVAHLAVTSTKPRAWAAREIAIVEETAQRIWEAVERAHAEEALRINEKRMRGQKGAFQAAINGATLEDSLGMLARIVTEEMAGQARTAFYIADPDVTFLDPIRGAGDMPESYTKQVERFAIGKDSLACGLATATGRPVLTRDVFEEPLWKPWVHLAKEYDFRGCWSFPIETRDGKPIGTFAMYFTAAREAGSEDLALADVVTRAAAIIISRHTEAQERARAEGALGKSEERHRTLVENVGGHAIFMLDPDGIITEWTEGARRVKGYSAEEVVGRHFSMFCTPEEVAAGEPERLLDEAAREGRAEREAWRVHKDGGRIWANEVVTAVRDAEGNLVGFTKISRDLTERRALEQERERLRTIELTALAEASERERISRELHDRVAHHMGVAHQSLELYVAFREANPERAAERLDLARQTTKVALDQTRSLSAELKRLQEEELEEGLEAAFGKLAESYVPDGVVMDVSLSGEESKIPNSVGAQVYLAMREAVKNAIRHSGCSRISVKLEVGDGELRGLVEDDGEGFDPKAVEETTPSWGVGLRSMRERAEMLGGILRVDSQPGAGARVALKVPLDGLPS